jgi:hypothetical protein
MILFFYEEQAEKVSNNIFYFFNWMGKKKRMTPLIVDYVMQNQNSAFLCKHINIEYPIRTCIW